MRMSNLRSRLPPLGTLTAFEAACRHGSFTRAAAELNLTQAAVSRQIRLLEDHLGVPLFERRRHDVALTAEGARFAAQANAGLIQIADAAAQLRGSRFDLTICAEFCLAAHWLMPRLSQFQTAHPDLKLRIVTASDPLRAGELFDVALAYGLSHDPSLRSEPLIDDCIVPLAAPALRASLPERCTASDLAACVLLDFDAGGHGWMDWPRFLGMMGAEPRHPSGLVFGTYNNALDAAMQGLGWVLGWGTATHQPVADGRLVGIAEFSVPSPDPLCAHLPVKRRASAAAEQFVAWVGSVAQIG